MKNIFIVPKGLSAGVINAQMVEMVSNLNALYEEKSVILIHQSDREKVSSVHEVYNSLYKYLIQSKDVNYLYVRSTYDFMIAYLVKKTLFKRYKIIYDYRGLVSEESYLRNQSSFRKRIIGSMEEFIYNRADKVHTVSHFFKNYLIDRFGQKNIKVYPCAINRVIKKEYSSSRSIHFVYLGSITSWQKFDEVIKLYKSIGDQLDSIKLTVITNQKEEAEQKILNSQVKNVIIKSLTHNEVLKDLENYDFGFLLRDNILVNNVASPIKFLEYISNGVIPIMSHGIGDYSEMVETHNIGMILDQEFTLDIDKLKNFLDDTEVYTRLEQVSSVYIWKNILEGFYSE